MDILRLNPATWYPDGTLIEGYDSCIWTERYTPAGEFQIKTSQIELFKELLPEKSSYITHADTREVMRVETHEETEDEKTGVVTLTIKGRTFESFLENRFLTGDYNQPWTMLKEYTVQDAILVILWNTLINESITDVTGSPSAKNIIENIPVTVVTDSTTANVYDPITTPSGGSDYSDLVSADEWSLDSSDVYSKILDLLNIGNLGIRIIRPYTDFDREVTVGTDGTIAKGPNKYTSVGTDPIEIDSGGGDKLRFDVYNGDSHRAELVERNASPPVIFRYDIGDIMSPNRLRSVKDYRNYVLVRSSEGDMVVWDPSTGDFNGPGDTARLPRGLGIKMMQIDLGTIDADVTDIDKYLYQKGLAALKTHNYLKLMDGSISPTSKYNYGEHYSLGDVVTLFDTDEVQRDMRVMEFIRSEDINGEVSYPTLVDLTQDTGM